MNLRRALWIVLAAWAVRLVYIAQIRAMPTFDVPLVDAANYFRTASTIASGHLLGGSQVFWQPPLYPYFLALLLSAFGQRMVPILAVQAAIGAVSCLLVYAIGRRVFGEPAGLAAAVVMMFYGPLVHFDAQPLIPVLHIALTLAGLLLLLRAGSRRGVMAAGIVWGLSATATPNLLLAVPAAAAWIVFTARPAATDAAPDGSPRHRAAGLAAAFVAGVALPVLLVAARNLVVAGEPVLISSNGGINFYIGNNADYERTIRIRPGGEFERLAQEPENLGIVGASARSRYFSGRAWRFLSAYPGPAARLYARKAADLIAGREIPRNQDMYEFRHDSPLLRALLWRLGIAFPFGVVAPLALAGACRPSRDPAAAAGWRLLILYAVSYAVSILIFFPADRYRLPLVPIAALFAGNLLAAPASLKRPAVLAALLGGLVLFNLDALRPRERYPEEEALNRAYALRTKGRAAEARAEYRRAMALNPARVDPYNALAAMAVQEGNWDEAAGLYRRLVEIAPDFVEARRALGQAYLAQGRMAEARREWEIAASLAPGAALALADLCMSWFDEGALAIAEPYCEKAVRARPDLPDTHLAMARVARNLGRTDRARDEAAAAARLYPEGSPGREKAERILRRLGERSGAGVDKDD